MVLFALSCTCLRWGGLTRHEACAIFVCPHLYWVTFCTVSAKMFLLLQIHQRWLWAFARSHFTPTVCCGYCPLNRAQAQAAVNQMSVGYYWEERGHKYTWRTKFRPSWQGLALKAMLLANTKLKFLDGTKGAPDDQALWMHWKMASLSNTWKSCHPQWESFFNYLLKYKADVIKETMAAGIW